MTEPNNPPASCQCCDQPAKHDGLCVNCLIDDYDEDVNDCANCGGEGFVYGCGWDWQCDTYDEGEGTCLCTSPCEWCSPPKRDPALQSVLGEAIAKATGERA
jgi:hypothetical protein